MRSNVSIRRMGFLPAAPAINRFRTGEVFRSIWTRIRWLCEVLLNYESVKVSHRILCLCARYTVFGFNVLRANSHCGAAAEITKLAACADKNLVNKLQELTLKLKTPFLSFLLKISQLKTPIIMYDILKFVCGSQVQIRTSIACNRAENAEHSTTQPKVHTHNAFSYTHTRFPLTYC